MLTSDDIYRIDFDTKCGNVWIPHSIIFNITQISEEEVRKLIALGEWDEDARLV